MNKAINEVVFDILIDYQIQNKKEELKKFIKHLAPIMSGEKIYNEMKVAIDVARGSSGMVVLNSIDFTKEEVENICKDEGYNSIR